MKELYFDHHLENWEQLFGHHPGAPTTPENHSFFTQRAQHDHAIAVWDPLFKLAARASLEVPNFLSNKDARIYLQFGAGRRLHDLFEVYRSVVLTAYERRKDALEQEEQRKFSRDLNTLYINLRGTLDNLAFGLMYECQPNLKKQLRDTEVGLFSLKFRAALAEFPRIAIAIERHDAWNKDVKSRRDPAAHRIPLYLPSQISKEDAARAKELITER